MCPAYTCWPYVFSVPYSGFHPAAQQFAGSVWPLTDICKHRWWKVTPRRLPRVILRQQSCLIHRPSPGFKRVFGDPMRCFPRTPLAIRQSQRLVGVVRFYSGISVNAYSVSWPRPVPSQHVAPMARIRPVMGLDKALRLNPILCTITQPYPGPGAGALHGLLSRNAVC